ncbi:Hsp20 family protein [Pigmentibacter sp. JX0631]|uniref:Hsp20 family protein n=1 Tax=Pigmentibacter sp. JX0631 TaxID=2976982 RepID=UPI00246862F0|nr:Hsp20 family protein [Pigmentibacter sp. JX0631]WGL59965.1 Hsp20 family protein [Pigmentibacter sp. JX0631]
MYRNHFRKHLTSQNSSLPFFGFHSEVGNLLNSIFSEQINENNSEIWFRPSLDIIETKEHFLVTLELSGVSQKDVEISLEKNILTISGEKKKKELDKETSFYRSEISYGKFKRSIEFPEKANSEAIEAELKDGILAIKIGKILHSEAKKIEIKLA